MIEAYSFGKIIVNGQTYYQDIIITPRGVRSNWWRKEGHCLHISDLEDVLLEIQPEVLVIGKGSSGMMKVPNEFQKTLKAKNIEVIAENTNKAVQIYNELATKKRVVGAFHLTC